MDVILTGLRTNAEYHLGNYLGAILPMVELQKKHINDYQINMFAPDLHSFTTPIDNAKLYQQTLDNLKLFVAAGMPIDHPNFYLYRQSYIPAHSEATIILNNFCYYGELSRMTQFKDKSSDSNQNITAGLFDYPVLMAADILLYGAKYIPVGDDQKQHLELAREIAQRINHKFEPIFTVPEYWSNQLVFRDLLSGVRIRSLKNPLAKMSKSIDDPNGTIKLSDTPEVAAKKIMGATTDNKARVDWDWKEQPGITNLLQILHLITKKSQLEITSTWIGETNYGKLKTEVAKAVYGVIEGIQSNLSGVDIYKTQEKINLSEAAMNIQANQTLLKIQKVVGLRR
jgi:tryptophanyl-tRNA synthetase